MFISVIASGDASFNLILPLPTSKSTNSGSVDIPFIISSPSAKLLYKYNGNNHYEETVSLTQTDAGKEIISKQLHDNALDDFVEYLNKKQLLNIITDATSGEEQIGNYVKIKSTFNLFDLDYLKNLTNSDSMRAIISLTTENLTTPKQSKGKQNQRLEPAVERGIRAIDTILKYLTSILPTQLYLKQGGYIAPLVRLS
ncbi:hypothetical protein MNQ98_09315 [Paenibacillus sp. N3/727]|uniref:DUF6414 family protein n=1 Tax=Paenibacillus sp. N3/727 TaxID=2925845 RepID=UPI001F53D99F|nr:hypothetical protein [Paenibacillus sp. N3/727]UNK20186.1 hypothetical protein MNQ98_09315 [Paenibacillus sp. N3/727]